MQNLSPNEKKLIERLILHKDKEDRILLLTAIADDKIDSVKLILDLVEEICDGLTHKLVLNSRDKNGQTAYLLARKKENYLSQIKNFAEKTGNLNYLEAQEKEAKALEKRQQSPLSILCIKKTHLSG